MTTNTSKMALTYRITQIAAQPKTPAQDIEDAARDVIDYARALVNFYRERGEFLPVMVENLGESLDDLDAARAATEPQGGA